MDFSERINIITGHYGTGKTNLAVNMAFDLRKKGNEVTLVDLDIVNPYYRSADFKVEMENAGIKVLTTNFANTNLDVPSIPAEIFSVFDDKNRKVIFDIGGDESGTMALGRYRSYIKDDSYELFYVINENRKIACETDDNISLMKNVEIILDIPVSRIVNNTHLCNETTKEIIIGSEKFTRDFCKKTGKAYGFTCVEEKFYDELKNKIVNPYKIKIYSRINEMI